MNVAFVTENRRLSGSLNCFVRKRDIKLSAAV